MPKKIKIIGLVLLILVLIGGVLFFSYKKNWFGLFKQSGDNHITNDNGNSLISGFDGAIVDDTDNDKITGDQKNVVYKNTEETGKLRLDIDYPEKAKGPFPVVIFIHGGGWVTGDKSSLDSRKWLPKLAEAGFAAVSINYRLAPQTTYPGPVEDVESALKFLQDNAKKYNLQAENIAIMGSSAGAQLGIIVTLKANKAKAGAIKAVVDLWGPVDLTDPNFSDETKGYINQFLGDSSKAAEASPINMVDASAPPFFIAHGDRDNVVPYDQSVRLQNKLKEVKVKAALITILNGVHYFVDSSAQVRPTRSQLQTRINEFLKRYLVK